MKFLRTLYMIVAGILLLPVILIVEIVFFMWLIAKLSNIENSVCVWLEYLKRGIEMNINFVTK